MRGVQYGGMESLMLWGPFHVPAWLPGCPPHAARLAVGAVAFVLCSGVTRESEAALLIVGIAQKP